MSDQLAEALEMWDSDIANGLIPDPVLEAPILDAARVHLSCNTVTEAEVEAAAQAWVRHERDEWDAMHRLHHDQLKATARIMLEAARLVREGNQ